jgi:DNA mismatch endonuclease (patch repair protein)
MTYARGLEILNVSIQLLGMDRISPEHRSWNMSRIRYRDTTPERTVRSLLHGLGLRFSLHRRDLPGKPDVVLPARRTVVFVHGCFWQQHAGCKLAVIPGTRTEFWEEKLGRNVQRDAENERALQRLGWRVVTVWECELAKQENVRTRLALFFGITEA